MAIHLGNSKHLDVNVIAARFTGKDFGAGLFPSAGPVLEADPPPMPAANYHSELHQSFTQGKSQMGTQILYGIKPFSNTEYCDSQAFSFDRITITFGRDL